MAASAPAPSLKEEVREALLKRKGKFMKIAFATGISYSWLHKFASGERDNPEYERLRKLAEFFAAGTI
jgi:transcriptional regulator with XRE-family HTH domain